MALRKKKTEQTPLPPPMPLPKVPKKRRGGNWPANALHRHRILSSPRKRGEILKALCDGHAYGYAAAMCGTTLNTLFSEMSRDQEFKDAVRQAREEGKVNLVAGIIDASKKKISGDWKAAAWLLERVWWREFGKHDPDAITPNQLAAAVSRITAIIMTEVPPEHHEVLKTKISEILSNLSSLKNERSGRRTS